MLCIQEWPNHIYRLSMYPLCTDCIYRKQLCLKTRCRKTNVDTYQSRKDERLCGDEARFFSPAFSSLANLGINFPIREDKIRHDTMTNRSASHRTGQRTDRGL